MPKLKRWHQGRGFKTGKICKHKCVEISVIFFSMSAWTDNTVYLVILQNEIKLKPKETSKLPKKSTQANQN